MMRLVWPDDDTMPRKTDDDAAPPDEIPDEPSADDILEDQIVEWPVRDQVDRVAQRRPRALRQARAGEQARLLPLPKAALGRGGGTQIGGVDRSPRAASAHHEPDRFHGST